jgi:hypothetical protein
MKQLFLPYLGAFYPMTFTDSLPWLTFVVVMFTLAITLVGLSIARRAAQQIKATEPWLLTKLEGDLWLLKRNTPVIATIHGIIVEKTADLENVQTLEDLASANTEGQDEGFKFMSPANGPSKYFRNGTNILLRIDPENHGDSFTLYYEEHKKESKQPYTGYKQGMKAGDIMPSKVKVWNTNLY